MNPYPPIDLVIPVYDNGELHERVCGHAMRVLMMLCDTFPEYPIGQLIVLHPLP